MKATIDEDSCRGHGVCWTMCPEVFLLTDDGYAEVQLPVVPVELEAAVRSAVANCPERAISVS